MPQTISLYKLFLASPSDVKEERLIVENVINEFNNTYSSQLNARIELCSWEKSSYPSVGEYPQAVINFQIGDEYDIFLVCMQNFYYISLPYLKNIPKMLNK